MKANILCAAIAALLAGSAALAAACSSPPPARLPDNVFAAIVYNDHTDRWHAIATAFGDQPQSSLGFLCLTEPGNAAYDFGFSIEHTGVNIDAQPGETQGMWRFDWSWRIDGREWQGRRWSLSKSWNPPKLEAPNIDEEAALWRALRNARTAELIGKNDGEEQYRVEYDLTTLFDTPIQFAIDECNQAAIEAQTGSYHSAYAYWFPGTDRHNITLTERDPSGERSILLSCGPTSWIDDDAANLIYQAKDGIYAAASLNLFTNTDLIVLTDNSNQPNDQIDAPTIESATVTWTNEDGQTGTAVWNANHHWLQPQSASENLQFIEILRDSEQLTVTVEAPTLEPTKITLHGAALFNKPMGPELDACIREYADLNG